MEIKIHCLLWTGFTTCPSVFIVTVDFEQVSAGWEAKGGINYRILLNVSKLLYWNEASEINKNSCLYFYWNYVCFFVSFAYWKF